ncbi:hypothetical protein [Planctomycetes bacterium K23_9]|uniref:Uncharacterized protein n=1 Tax=Stieleria marina TaxID=1930275 RepID=A0A517NZ59_9BACT|nr:hypothetical protein K239x_44240 [Planctomycetes bacterium K23_9]
MWTIKANQLGQANWNTDQIKLTIDARGGDHGIHVDGDDGRQWFRLDAIEGKELSPVAEQYVRGNELHLWLPQGDNEFGVKITLEPIASQQGGVFVLQATVSIQTTLLDSHPKLDVIAAANGTKAVGEIVGSGSPPVSIATRDGKPLAVVLGKHDSPFTSSSSTGDQIALRLFGDFLEKGVIRKARPWFVFGEVAEEQLLEYARELSNSPLPLTP